MSNQPITLNRGKTTPKSSGGSFKSDGNTDPDGTLPAPERTRLTPEQASARIKEFDVHIEVLEEQQFLAAQDGLSSTVLDRFPNATAIELRNTGEDDGESLFDVSVVRAGKDVLWEAPDFFDDSSEDDDAFVDATREFSMQLDRKGMDFWDQDPDENTDVHWSGFNL